MSWWLLLADPKSYGFDQLERDRTTVWDGIGGSLAQKRMRSFRRGDRVLIYHTSPDKAVVGTATVVTEPYPDPADDTGKRVVVRIECHDRLRKPVLLDRLKQDKRLSGMAFLKIQRIAVSPLEKAEFDTILKIGN
jgi:predicted RNA-binding protein with PUA-like domain